MDANASFFVRLVATDDFYRVCWGSRNHVIDQEDQDVKDSMALAKTKKLFAHGSLANHLTGWVQA